MRWNSFDELVAELPQIHKKIQGIREIILGNLVMIGEIPAPTFHEQGRVDFLNARFEESGVVNCSLDECNNLYGIWPGVEGQQNILLSAHTDTLVDEDVDHTITVQTDKIYGPAVGDNSLGVAVLASLPKILDYLDIKFRSNLILMGDARSLGRGDLAGLRFFLANTTLPIMSAISIGGVQLGRLSYASLGMARGEITCTVPDEYDWTRFGSTNAILNLNTIINRIVQIPLARQPQTVIVLGSIEGGNSYGMIARHAVLHFEIRSESLDMVNTLQEKIEDITQEIATQTNTPVELEFFAKRSPGGLPFSHPFCKHARKIIEAVGVQPQILPSVSELSLFIQRRIPAVTIGLTRGTRAEEEEEEEFIEIEPIWTGLAQLIGMIAAIDGGWCREN